MATECFYIQLFYAVETCYENVKLNITQHQDRHEKSRNLDIEINYLLPLHT